MTTETTPFGDRFVEAAPLGRGGEGRLFRVRDRWTGRWGALKLAAHASSQKGLLDEFRLLSRLRHPCLIESHDLLDASAERGHLLEYLPAVDPLTLWNEGGEEAVWAATLQTLRALSYLHRHGFVHGDVTPGNILVWREGSDWRAKLADLGLTLSGDEAAVAGVRGTPGYWAPETAAGKGARPASDFYSLGATMLAWIDGASPWADRSPADQLRHLATMPDLPKPRRRVSPELETFLAVLGSSRSEARTGWDWAELRSRTAAWGPPTLVATISGIDPQLKEWAEWIHGLPGGGAAALVLAGRVGTGRHTALRSLGRALASEGWMTIWASPLSVLHDRFAQAGTDLDPVVAARELGVRCEGKHLVFLWSERATDLEARILRAFIAAREDASSGIRTVVLRATGVEAADEVVEWLRGSTRCRAESWRGLATEALREIAGDLLAPEDGLGHRAEFDAAQTPLTLEVMKQAIVHGSSQRSVEVELESELAGLWDRVSARAREALSLMAESSLGWEPEDLASVLGWTEEEARTHVNELGRLGLIHRTFEQGAERDVIADALTRQSVLDRRDVRTCYPVTRVREGLESGERHPGDLALARHFFRRSEPLPGYTLSALDVALREGRYEEVLEFAEEARPGWEMFGRHAPEVWSRFLRAASRTGKYETEVRVLRQLLSGVQGSEEIAYRKALSQSLVHLGEWKQALEECTVIEANKASSDRDRIWARLQRAETLWQAGQFSEADKVYAEAESLLAPQMTEEWLRYGVGRARQHGQRGDMGGVKKYLELAERRAGAELCQSEPMYLHTLGGWLIEKSDLITARPLLQTAGQRASENGDWATYVMIASREASLTYDLGEMKSAAKVGRDGVATAEALASRRIISYTNAFLGFIETHLGNAGSAWRRGQRVLDLGHQLGDKNIEILGFRLRAFIASSIGWKSLTEEATAKMDEIGTAMGERETIAFASLCRGMFHYSEENWSEAKENLLKARRDFAEIGQLTSELKTRIYLALLDYFEGRPEKSRAELSGLIDLSTSQKAALLMPVAKLAFYRVGPSSEEVSASAVDLIMDLEFKGRNLDIIEWGALGLGHYKNKNQVRAQMLNAVQRIADSLDDVQLRREFLGSHRTRKALMAIKA